MQRLRWGLAAVCLVVLVACGGAPPTEPPDVGPIALSVVSGDGETGPVGTELPSAVVVRVTRAVAAFGGSADPEPVPGQLVNFVVVQGGGSVFAGSAVTNAAGEARERWTLGTTAGAQALEVRAVDATTGDPIVFERIDATAEPGAAVKLVQRMNAQGQAVSDTAAVGEALTLRDYIWWAEDEFGNHTDNMDLGYTLWDPACACNPTETKGEVAVVDRMGYSTLMLWVQGRRDLGPGSPAGFNVGLTVTP